MKIFRVALAAVLLPACCRAAEVGGRTWDVLSNDALAREDTPVVPFSPDHVAELGGRQIPLCMIGDSITWAQEGDYWRKWLLRRMPSVAFAGTHTARFGYSHAGEGGNSTFGVLKRIDDRKRVPDCPYYHLMIGINDSSAAKCAEDVPQVASNAVVSIGKIVDRLLARPCTKTVFLASILPGNFPENPFRDAAGSAANEILRATWRTRFPADRVVWIEYERPLREDLARWKSTDCLSGAHPLKKGYRVVADMLADVLERTVPAPSEPQTAMRWGVAVENLWDETSGCSRTLIPGWYVCSFAAPVPDATVTVRLRNRTKDPKGVFDRTFAVGIVGDRRGEFEFMTGYQGYGYDMSPFVLEATDAEGRPIELRDVQIEKMRPSRRASRYGRGAFVDPDSPICAGELLVPSAGRD